MHNFEIAAFRIKMEYKYAVLRKSSDFNHHEEFFPLHRRDGGRIRCWSPYYGYRLFRITRPAQIIREDAQRKSQAK